MMDTMKLQSADFLDILFDGRNKAYGAYALRRAYNSRLGIAIVIMLLFCATVYFISVFSDSGDLSTKNVHIADTVSLVINPDKAVKPPILPPPPPVLPATPPQVAMAQFTPPKIVVDELMPPDESLPEVPSLENVQIGVINSKGIESNVVQPPASSGAFQPLIQAGEEAKAPPIFTKVELPAEFPGGVNAWRRYLERYLQYPETAISNETQGVVMVQFIIDPEGNISDVKALNDPGDGLAAEAVRIIVNGPKWRPAEQNGQKVYYRHQQAISFKMEF